MKKSVFKSIGVIILAFVINAMLSMLTDYLLESIGVLPDPNEGMFGTGYILLVLFYRAIYTILAGFIVAKLAPNKLDILERVETTTKRMEIKTVHYRFGNSGAELQN
jgi:hypothetical protein